MGSRSHGDLLRAAEMRDALRKSSPPTGFHPAAGSKKGGWTDGKGNYWYPDRPASQRKLAIHPVGSGKNGKPPAPVPVHDVSGAYGWVDDPAVVPAGKIGIVHINVGRVVQTMTGAHAATAAKAAVKELGAEHSHRGSDKGHGGFLGSEDVDAVRKVIGKHAVAAVSKPAGPPSQSAPAPSSALPTSGSTLQWAAPKPGGAFAGAVVTAPGHPGKYLVKPDKGPVKPAAEVAGSTLAALVRPGGTVRSGPIDLAGAAPKVAGGLKHGSIQPMAPNGGDLPKHEAGLLGLPHDVQHDIVASAVANWLVSDHDAHGAQYLLAPGGDGAIRIDFGQSFKHIGEDKLDLDYHPNAKYGEARPAPQILLRAVAAWKIDLDLNHPRIVEAIERAESITDQQIAATVAPYAKVVEAAFGKPAAATLAQVRSRRDNIRADFEALFSRVLSKRAGKPVSFAFAPLKKGLRLSLVGAASVEREDLDDESGELTARGAVVVRELARALLDEFGDQVVRWDDAGASRTVSPLLVAAASLRGVVDEVLLDADTRAMFAEEAA